MTTIYNANGTLPQSTQPFAPFTNTVGSPISGSTNASPIVVNVVAHGYSTGDTVFIERHLVNTNANGRWAITVVDADHFSLNGSTGNGVGAATGSSFDYSVNPLITLPSDGDPIDASHINPQVEGVFNAVPFLYERCGHYRLLNVYNNQAAAANPVTAITSMVVPMGAVWQDFTGMTALLSGGFVGHAPGILANDILDISLTTSIQSAIGDAAHAFGIGLSLDGATNIDLATNQALSNFGTTIKYAGLALHGFLHFGLGAFHTLSDVSLRVFGNSGVTVNPTIVGNWQVIVKHYRSNA